MMDLVRIEIFKFRTQRSLVIILLLGLALAALQMVLLFAAIKLDPQADLQLEDPSLQRQLLTSAGTTLIAVLLSVLGMTSEFRHGTIATTVRAVPDRSKVVISKAITYALIACVYGVLAAALNQIGARAVLAFEGIDVLLSGAEVARGVAKNVLSLVLFAVAGAGVAAAVTNQVAALVAIFIESFASGIVGIFLPSVGKFLPSPAMTAFTAGDGFREDDLSPEAGLAVFACYVLVAMAAGISMLRRRDIG